MHKVQESDSEKVWNFVNIYPNLRNVTVKYKEVGENNPQGR